MSFRASSPAGRLPMKSPPKLSDCSTPCFRLYLAFRITVGKDSVKRCPECLDVGKLWEKSAKVGDAAVDRSDTGRREFAPRYGKRVCECVQVHVPHEGPVNHDAVPGKALCIAGAFPAACGEVVAAGALNVGPKLEKGFGNDVQGIAHLVYGAGYAVVEVSQVVINGAAACHAPGQENAVLPEVGEIDLCIGTLVEADNH